MNVLDGPPGCLCRRFGCGWARLGAKGLRLYLGTAGAVRDCLRTIGRLLNVVEEGVTEVC
jgi:hypothetical protein